MNSSTAVRPTKVVNSPRRLGTGPYRLGVIGDPVAHSLSPALHQPALDALGIPATYERWHTPAEQIAERVAGLRDPDVLGANVTVPHKLAVFDLVDEISSTAQRAGAVNTIVNRDGRLFGDNTDIYGFQAAMREVLGEELPTSALVLGAGGAARAVVIALDAMGVPAISLANRNPERAARLAAVLAPTQLNLVELTPQAIVPALQNTTLLVNATSLGWHTGETPLALELLAELPAQATVADLTYRDTDLLQAAAARGLRAVDGLGMLVHQGAQAFERFTGQDAPVATMYAAARAARDRRV